MNENQSQDRIVRAADLPLVTEAVTELAKRRRVVAEKWLKEEPPGIADTDVAQQLREAIRMESLVAELSRVATPDHLTSEENNEALLISEEALSNPESAVVVQYMPDGGIRPGKAPTIKTELTKESGTFSGLKTIQEAQKSSVNTTTPKRRGRPPKPKTEPPSVPADPVVVGDAMAVDFAKPNETVRVQVQGQGIVEGVAQETMYPGNFLELDPDTNKWRHLTRRRGRPRRAE